ncbi:GntR family transcriptional regulator [Gluconobacter cerinus]|uniref:GntR family transcriptional regulator n=1 Tax=Gluconobacter cerinus TaxID=38307 RepID=A0AAV5NHT9_9PROT|nr:PLP-dependent aminotransferase family protein [Gluconobacter cerinus]GLQ63901.1 GntR family transcriptional regulator [Gluconobacter cerinus]
MVMFLPFLDRQSDESLQKQIVRQMVSAITNGTLRPGEALAGIRECATNWGVSRNTVMHALEHLEAEGYVEKRPSQGTYVHRTPPRDAGAVTNIIGVTEVGEAAHLKVEPLHNRAFASKNNENNSLIDSPSTISLGFGNDQPVYRSLEWKRTLQKLFHYENWKRGGQYQSNAGLPFLRETIARWLTARHGVSVDERQVIIVAGLQQAHSLVAQALLAPGMTVALEDPCYIGKRLLYEKLGLHILNLPVDEKGVKLSCATFDNVQLICVNPGCQVPTNAPLSLPRRRKLVTLAAQTQTPIFEESMFDLLMLEGKSIPSLLSLSGGQNVIHAGLFAPALGGGMMLGYMVVPWPLLPAILDAKLILDNGLPWLEQEALARFIDSGDLDDFLKRRRMSLMRRQEHLVSAMKRQWGDFSIFNASHAPRMSWFLPGPISDSAAYIDNARKLNLHIPGDYPLHSRSPTSISNLDRLISHGYGELAESDIDKAVHRMIQSNTV